VKVHVVPAIGGQPLLSFGAFEPVASIFRSTYAIITEDKRRAVTLAVFFERLDR
jgi:hypothetical protein